MSPLSSSHRHHTSLNVNCENTSHQSLYHYFNLGLSENEDILEVGVKCCVRADLGTSE